MGIGLLSGLLRPRATTRRFFCFTTNKGYFIENATLLTSSWHLETYTLINLFMIIVTVIFLLPFQISRTDRWSRWQSSFVSCSRTTSKIVFLIIVLYVIYQTTKTVFDHREESWKYDAQRCIFDELWGVWKCGQTLSWMFDIFSIETKTYEITER